ncbi:MAG: hypothetical protein U1E65_31555 [Myxococcota bacterium]
MSKLEDTRILLTVRGTVSTSNLDLGRKLHDETAGSAAGIAAARALGDLSHKVFVPAAVGDMGGTKPSEVLFIDVWEHPDGLQKFFANKDVQEQGGKLFKERDHAVWMPARGAHSLRLDAPAHRQERYVGIIRVPVTSPEAAIEAFRASGLKHLRDARRRGQISHDLYFRMMPPVEAGAKAELLGVDVWFDKDGMLEQYKNEMSELGSVFAGAPTASIWQQPSTAWSEW